LLVSYPLVTAKWPKPTLIDLRYPNGFALRAQGLRLADDGKKPAAKSSTSSASHASRVHAPDEYRFHEERTKEARMKAKRQ